MKTYAGLLLTLAGCTSLPVRSEQPPSDGARLVLPPASSTHLRVGVEYLPPETRRRTAGSWFDPDDRTERAQPRLVSVDPVLTRTAPLHPETALRFGDLQKRWTLDLDEIHTKSNPIERMTLRFLAEMIGDDRKRVHRAVGASLLGAELRRSTDPMSNFLDERDREDQQRRLRENCKGMIRRPLRNALKELPVFTDVEIAIHEFKDANREYTDKRALGLGRISVRIRGSRNPVELRWIRGGLRVSSNLESGKASFTTQLAPKLSLTLRSRYHYDEQDWRLFGSLQYALNSFTTLHALAGNEINILGGPTSFPGGPQSEQTSRGVLVYVEHDF